MSKKKKKFRGRVFKIFKENSSKSFNYKQIAARLNISDTQKRTSIIKVLKQLNAQKAIKEIEAGKYILLVNEKKYFEGTLSMKAFGNAYLLMPEYNEDVFIARKNTNRALDGDRVLVYQIKNKKNEKIEGKVLEILDRSMRDYVGILNRNKDYGFVNVHTPRNSNDFLIEKEELKKFKDGDKVIVNFKDWPKKATSPHGKIIKSLGKPGELNTEMNAIMFEYGLEETFSPEVECFARNLDLRINKKEISKRKDFRNKTTFTIDPVNAKDFDDALSFTPLSNGGAEIGIHIADVSHFVQPNTILDEVAFERATSVYLVDRVVPMLPEILSNEACSLKPKEEKYTFSAVFTVNNKMEIEKEWFGKTIISSDHRFSYEEVQYILDNKDTKVSEEVSLSKKEYTVTKEIFAAILQLDTFAKLLRKKRISKGAISFDRVEVKFNLSKEKKPESIYFKSSKDAHKLVEEFMLLANRRVAEFIGKQKNKSPFVYRVHDLPDEEKLLNLKSITKNLGYQLNLETNNINKCLNKLLKEAKGKKEQELIDILVIRSMSKAVYSTDNIGHYGLAFESYTHFTSPIRRYPDILVHRLLDFYSGGLNKINTLILEEACTHSSNREQLASKAERDSIKYMQVKFMQDKIDRRYNALISGVSERGIYVEIIENKCEGLVKISEIEGDYFIYEERSHSIIGKRTSKIYRLGDSVKVILKKTDLVKRQMDFILDKNNK